MKHTLALMTAACLLSLSCSVFAESAANQYNSVLMTFTSSFTEESALRYGLVDLDGNGIDELLIYLPAGEKLDVRSVWPSDSSTGAPLELLHATDTTSYTLTFGTVKGYHIVMEERVSSSKTGRAFFQLRGTSLQLNDALICDYDLSLTNPWLYAMDTTWDESAAFPVSTAEATAMLSGYIHCTTLENSRLLTEYLLQEN